jgi:hypothetical protein
MADKSTALILEALSRAVTDPAGMPLYGSKAMPGLFAASATSRQAAETCKQNDYLRVVRTETRGKATHEVCALTEKGLHYLLSQSSPKKVLEALVRALEASRKDLTLLTNAVQQMAGGLDALKASAEKVMSAAVKGDMALTHSQWLNKSNGTPAPDLCPTILSHLARWQAATPTEDCPLPELYRRLRPAAVTIGQFHDALRSLHDRAQVYLHPWTGPLYEIPDPALALMVGHALAYYASPRGSNGKVTR